MPNENELSLQAKQLWGEVKEMMGSLYERPLTPLEFYYLLSCYPYLEICDVDYPYIEPGKKPKVFLAKNGWPVFDYGSVLCSGVYELFARPDGKIPQLLEVEDGDGGDEGGNGTVVNQYTDAAFLLIDLAMEKGWKAAEVISGFYPMQRMAWIASTLKGYLLKGFDPTPEDRVVQVWVEKLKKGEMYPSKQPFVQRKDSAEKRLT
jgi:hypothetical protein